MMKKDIFKISDKEGESIGMTIMLSNENFLLLFQHLILDQGVLMSTRPLTSKYRLQLRKYLSWFLNPLLNTPQSFILPSEGRISPEFQT